MFTSYLLWICLTKLRFIFLLADFFFTFSVFQNFKLWDFNFVTLSVHWSRAHSVINIAKKKKKNNKTLSSTRTVPDTCTVRNEVSFLNTQQFSFIPRDTPLVGVAIQLKILFSFKPRSFNHRRRRLCVAEYLIHYSYSRFFLPINLPCSQSKESSPFQCYYRTVAKQQQTPYGAALSTPWRRLF